MMKFAFFLIFPLLFAVLSCNDCNKVDCAPGDLIAVDYRSLADSTNLYQTGHFHMDSLQVFILERPDSLPVAVDLGIDARFPQNAFYLPINSLEVAGFILSPRPGLTDTFWVNLQLGPKSDCCGRGIEFTQGLLRSDTIRFAAGEKILTIYK